MYWVSFTLALLAVVMIVMAFHMNYEDKNYYKEMLSIFGIGIILALLSITTAILALAALAQK